MEIKLCLYRHLTKPCKPGKICAQLSLVQLEHRLERCATGLRLPCAHQPFASSFCCSADNVIAASFDRHESKLLQHVTNADFMQLI